MLGLRTWYLVLQVVYNCSSACSELTPCVPFIPAGRAVRAGHVRPGGGLTCLLYNFSSDCVEVNTTFLPSLQVVPIVLGMFILVQADTIAVQLVKLLCCTQTLCTLRVPIMQVVPFVLGMFILVEGLNATGWVDRLAWWLGSSVRGSVWAALFAVGSFSVLLANLANNQVGAGAVCVGVPALKPWLSVRHEQHAPGVQCSLEVWGVAVGPAAVLACMLSTADAFAQVQPSLHINCRHFGT